MNKPKLEYQQQDTSLTLQEALQEYYNANPHLLDASKFSNETGDFFRSHDRVHVVFGCDTTFMDESKADFWTIMGVDIGLRNYLKLAASPVVRDLYQDIKTKMTEDARVRLRKDIRQGITGALIAPFKVYLRARHMRRKWPWHKNDEYLNLPLREIRSDFGIEIL